MTKSSIKLLNILSFKIKIYTFIYDSIDNIFILNKLNDTIPKENANFQKFLNKLLRDNGTMQQRKQ